MKNFIEEMTWRGLVHDVMPGTEEILKKGVTTAYIGFDPTADSLHIGNLVQIMILKHYQLCGHKPIALVGGATGMVGDPSGKSQERNLLDEPTLRHNEASIRKQLEKFLDFKAVNAAEVVNNHDWFKDFKLLDFLRDVGKHISINYMLAKDSVQKRLESGLSFTEFSYQLIQGYDFYWLWKHKAVQLQLGGSDQWGNIVAGTELIRRMEQGEAYAMTSPLLTKVDGSKFGKSEDGNVWLDAEKTSPYKFYQYWLNISDEDVKRFVKIFSLEDRQTIEAKIHAHDAAPHLRLLQKSLAEEITKRVHSAEDLKMAQEASDILFGQSTTERLSAINEKLLLQIFEGVPQITIDRETWKTANSAVDLLSDQTHGEIFASKSEARRMIKAGGVSLNKQKIQAETIPALALLQGKYLLAQRGKRHYYLIKVEG